MLNSQFYIYCDVLRLLWGRRWSAGPKLFSNLTTAIIPEIMDAESLRSVFGPLRKYFCQCNSLTIHQSYKIQCVLRVFVQFQALTLSGPHTPQFLFHLQSSYWQHSSLETANQGSCYICIFRGSWSSVTSYGIFALMFADLQMEPSKNVDKHVNRNYLSFL
jgi:hypothetical protein